MDTITTTEQLEALYGPPIPQAIAKQAAIITPQYRALMEAATFAALATSGPEGLDCSPRGDASGLVRVPDERTILLPDRPGNNRADSLRNIIRDPRVAMLFLIPGLGMTMRANGRAIISVDPSLRESFAISGKPARSIVVITVDAVYFQCTRAVLRADLWNPERHVDPATLPTAGEILAAMSDCRFGGEEYDRTWPERAKNTLW
jgi:hypothetical protein